MSRIEKLIEKFLSNPETVKYVDLEKVLLHVGCEKIQSKGSHVKYKHIKLTFDIVIPVHKNECKPFYKKQVKKQIKKLI